MCSSKKSIKIYFRYICRAYCAQIQEIRTLVSLFGFLRGLDHPGIVKCFEWVQTKTSLYLVMELLEGGDLLQNIMKGLPVWEGSSKIGSF